MKHYESSLKHGHRSRFRPLLELLESRIVFASDFGDAPLPYKTLLVEGGAEHVAIGPRLGTSRDTEADGVHSASANGDDTVGSDDEDGVTFGTIRAGALDATATVTVSGGAANLDAWIDFNGDGSWGGPGEQIADSVAVTPGSNSISFDVPSTARDGTTFARFRLSTAGNLGPNGVAADGEVEDHAVSVAPPKLACGCFAGPNRVSIEADFPESVYAEDVDGDGDTDVLSASSNDNTIAWYENHGNQEFSQHVITTAAQRAMSVVAADVDGDGDMDVLSASSTDDKVAWYENDGNENFTTHIISTAANSPTTVFAADIDSDGDIDALSSSNQDDTIAWYENDGDEDFTFHVISTAADGAYSVDANDVDGDGDVDVLSASRYDDKVAWYENDGNENFSAHTISTAADNATSVYTTDVDNDGDVDVLSASRVDDTIAWYENDGNENFTEHAISTVADFASAVHAADVDSDGDFDVLSASANNDQIVWYENDGTGNFTTHPISTTADFAQSVVAADVDGDGDTDVLSTSRNDDKIAWYENDGNQNFATHDITIIVDEPWSVHAADIDNDGDMDIVSAAEFDAANIVWYENMGDQSFVVHIISSAADYARSIFTSDVDGDGDVDILSAYGGTANRIAWYENDGNENFIQHTITNSAFNPYSVYAADVDGDGDIDALSASMSDDQVAWYENDGNQNFTHHVITASANGANSVFVADVDGDGDTDVLSASYNDDRIAWYENDGSQNFTTHTISATAVEATAVFASDLDGDGDTDVLSTSVGDGETAWYENDGNQNFTAHIVGGTVTEPETVFAADLDGDTDMDIVVGGRAGVDRLVWYENDGNQNFIAHALTPSLAWIQSAFLTDVDSDGDLDIAVAFHFNNKIGWYENLNFVVVNRNDSGVGSLRQAIEQANATPGVDTITFAIASGPQTIAPTSALPTITDAVIIDGTTQPGYAGTPIIEIWGGAAGPNVHGLALAADNSAIKGLVVNLFSGNGILVTGSGIVIENSYIGTDFSGTVAVPNALNGIEIVGGFNNTIGGTAAGTANIIAFNDGHGILVDAGTNNAIQRNSIHSNDSLGIDLVNAGNNNQRAPSVNSAVSGNGTTNIAASLAMVVPSTTYTIEFFSSAVCDPSGFGEGETYLGSKTLTTTATGRGRTIFVVGFEVPVGHVITATATSPFDDTSEFSMCRIVTAGTAPGGNAPNSNRLSAVDRPLLAIGDEWRPLPALNASDFDHPMAATWPRSRAANAEHAVRAESASSVQPEHSPRQFSPTSSRPRSGYSFSLLILATADLDALA